MRACSTVRHPHRTAAWPDDGDGELADGRCRRVRNLAARVVAVIRIEAVWLATAPLDMRAGTDTALARVVNVFGSARPHLRICLPTSVPTV